MNFAPSRVPDATAPAGSWARVKSNGCMTASVPRRLANRGHDADVRAAAADVPAHPLPDLVVAARVSLAEQRHGRADLPGRAVAALEAVVADERSLHGMQPSAAGESLDGRDLLAAVHHRQREAGVDAAPVDEDRARPARPLIAAL